MGGPEDNGADHLRRDLLCNPFHSLHTVLKYKNTNTDTKQFYTSIPLLHKYFCKIVIIIQLACATALAYICIISEVYPPISYVTLIFCPCNISIYCGNTIAHIIFHIPLFFCILVSINLLAQLDSNQSSIFWVYINKPSFSVTPCGKSNVLSLNSVLVRVFWSKIMLLPHLRFSRSKRCL